MRYTDVRRMQSHVARIEFGFGFGFETKNIHFAFYIRSLYYYGPLPQTYFSVFVFLLFLQNDEEIVYNLFIAYELD